MIKSVLKMRRLAISVLALVELSLPTTFIEDLL
jgi:hypothetical protein